jgi:hypothetical protein
MGLKLRFSRPVKIEPQYPSAGRAMAGQQPVVWSARFLVKNLNSNRPAIPTKNGAVLEALATSYKR